METTGVGGMSMTLRVGMCIYVHKQMCVGGLCVYLRTHNTNRTFTWYLSSRDRLIEENDLRDRGP